MSSSTDDIAGLRQQIKDNATFLFSNNSITILLLKYEEMTFQVFVMDDKGKEALAFGPQGDTVQQAYKIALEILSEEVVRELKGKSKHIRFGDLLWTGMENGWIQGSYEGWSASG